MYGLIFSTLRALPWWAFLGLALLIGNASYSGYQGVRMQQTAAEQAIHAGLPPQVSAGDYVPRRDRHPLSEVHLRGVIRADLGIGRLGDGASSKQFIILDNQGRIGPLVALVFTGSDRSADLSQVVATSDATGRIAVAGFARTLDRSEVRGQLLAQGEMRDVYLIEPYIGDRAAALRGRATRDMVFVYLGAGVAGLLAIIGFARLRRWRNRTVRPKPRVPAMPTPAQPSAAGPSPWGNAAGTLPPPPAGALATPPAAAPRTGGPAPKPAEVVLPLSPEFKSVFPGGGSSFRYKSADDIIREKFGTLTVLQRTIDRPKQ